MGDRFSAGFLRKGSGSGASTPGTRSLSAPWCIRKRGGRSRHRVYSEDTDYCTLEITWGPA